MPLTFSKLHWQRWLRFLCGGAANTLFTYLLYLALSAVLGYQWAYFAAYASGIVLAYWLNATFVFKVPLSWKGLFAYPAVYLVQYPASAMLLEALVRFGHMPPTLAPLAVTAAMLPFTYVMNKWILRNKSTLPS